MMIGLFGLFSNIYSNSHERFQVKANGTIEVDGLQFSSMSEYLHSDYFQQTGKRCGTDHRRLERAGYALPMGSSSDCSLTSTTIKSEYYPAVTLTIPVVFHVIYKSDGTGNISTQRIHDQLTVLNEDYGAKSGTMGANGYNTKIQFSLASITRTQNNSWFNDENEVAYKTALGWDQNKYLNVYVNTASGYLGYSYLPQDGVGGANKVYQGVVLLYEAVGGRNNGYDVYDQGRTLVHEIGHHLGLLHTFEGDGCYTGFNAGDLINDTNPENTDHYGCTQTYSCGVADPIHNYMNYTDDSCMYQFTDEQANRLVCSLVNYRPASYSTSSSSPTITITSPNGGEQWVKGSTHAVKWSHTGTVGNVKIEYSTNNGGAWSTISASTSNDGTENWILPNTTSSQCLVRVKEASDGSPSDTSNGTFSITSSSGGSTPTIRLDRSQLYFTAVVGGATTSSQSILIDNSGLGTLSWTATDDRSWLSCTPAAGTNAGLLTIAVNPTDMGTGTYTGTITIVASGASNTPRTVTVTLVVINSWADAAPFGTLATPVSGSTVSGSIPVTGWALDDVDIQKVEIYAGYTYIGDAIFVPGTRPDVEAAYSGYPKNHKAGWGYMLLTHFLPGGGNGTYTLYAYAIDSAGHNAQLGSTTINVNNLTAQKPFGALDTPAQGGVASGSGFSQWGWVLTPPPNTIPTNGSTISVWVDGVNLGHPTYNLYRADLASLFPTYNNKGGAGGNYTLNTTRYVAGLHTIQWTATDNAGNTDGIGSRYFTILNTGLDAAQSTEMELPSVRRTLDPNQAQFNDCEPVLFKKGFASETALTHLPADDHGVIDVEIHELEPMEIRFAHSMELLSPRPIGSTMDIEQGIFYWQPGLAFVGQYEFAFVNRDKSIIKTLRVTILPKN